jgi:hypothetical protein
MVVTFWLSLAYTLISDPGKLRLRNNDFTMPFVPGVSGNPGGRPKGAVSVIGALKRLMDTDPNYSADVAAKIVWDHFKEGNPAAIKQVLDRLDGPIVNKVELDDVSNLSPEEREARLDQLANLGRARAVGSVADGSDKSDDLAE